MKSKSSRFLQLFIFLFLINLILSQVEHHTTKLDSPADYLNWCGKDHKIIFLLTERLSFYKSVDYGATWQKLDDKLIELANKDKQKNIDSKLEKVGRVGSIIESPVDPSLFVLLGTESYSWIIEDCEKITAVLLGRPIEEWVFHPTERNWALVSARTLCSDYVKKDEKCKNVKELFITQTLGNDWKLLGDYVNQFYWGIEGVETIKKGVPKERILLTYEPGGRGNQVSLINKITIKLDFAYSDDFFRTKTVAIRKANSFFFLNSNLYVSQVVDVEKEEVILLHAKTYEKKYNFNQVITNQKKFEQHRFNFLASSKDMSLLYINNFDKNAPFGNVYSSDEEGREFSYTLRNIFQVNDVCDFEMMIGTEGLFLANVISTKFMRQYQETMSALLKDKYSISQETKSNKKSQTTSPKNLIESIKSNIKTLISHNKGGDWSRLSAPSVDSQGNPYNCGENCYLHLYSYSSRMPRFYSVDNAVGVIIGNGNVGRYMDYSYNNVALFLSRDGGITWYEIRKGPHIYEIGDHGGLIVISKYDTPTQSVFYTYDEGITWDEVQISDVNIRIKNILNDDTSSKQKFVVYGIKESEGDTDGLIISLDFTTLKIRTCSSSDYEKWNPRSLTNKDINSPMNCILGKSVIYQRRKRESKCVNGEGFEIKLKTTICQCTDDDYECDFGFHRPDTGEPCVPIHKGTEQLLSQPPQICKGYYNVTKGYRKIPGNVCSGLSKYEPLKVSCPYNKVLYGLKIVFYIVLVTALIILIIYIRNNTNIELKDIIEGIASLKPSINFNMGKENTPQSYLSVDGPDEENEDGVFTIEPIQSKSESKKKSKPHKAKKSKDLGSKSGVINNPSAPQGETTNLLNI